MLLCSRNSPCSRSWHWRAYGSVSWAPQSSIVSKSAQYWVSVSDGSRRSTRLCCCTTLGLETLRSCPEKKHWISFYFHNRWPHHSHDTLSILTDKLLAKLVDGRTDRLTVAYTALVYLNLRVAYWIFSDTWPLVGWIHGWGGSDPDFCAWSGVSWVQYLYLATGLLILFCE